MYSVGVLYLASDCCQLSGALIKARYTVGRSPRESSHARVRRSTSGAGGSSAMKCRASLVLTWRAVCGLTAQVAQCGATLRESVLGIVRPSSCWPPGSCRAARKKKLPGSPARWRPLPPPSDQPVIIVASARTSRCA